MKNLCIIFDIDGVLTYSKKAIKFLYKNALSEFGYVEVPDSIFAQTYGKTDFEIYNFFVKQGFKINSYNKYRQAIEKYIEPATKYYELTPIGNVLHFLKKTNKLCIATNRTKPSAYRILNRFGIYNIFDYIATISDFKPKPSPDMLLACLKKTKSNREKTIFIGDSNADLEAGQLANIKTMIVAFE